MRRGTLLINRAGNIVAMAARPDGEASAKSSTRAVIIWRDDKVDPSIAALGTIFDASLVSGDWVKVDPMNQYLISQQVEFGIGDVVSPPASDIQYTIIEDLGAGLYSGVCLSYSPSSPYRVGQIVKGLSARLLTFVRKGDSL